jgi:hypothetical protein
LLVPRPSFLLNFIIKCECTIEPKVHPTFAKALY